MDGWEDPWPLLSTHRDNSSRALPKSPIAKYAWPVRYRASSSSSRSPVSAPIIMARSPTSMALKMLASNVPEPRADIGEDPAQASAIAEPHGQTFRLPHDPENVLVSSERGEGDPQLESRVYGLLESVGSLGQAFQGLQGVVEELASRHV